jgi:hypothetical protein
MPANCLKISAPEWQSHATLYITKHTANETCDGACRPLYISALPPVNQSRPSTPNTPQQQLTIGTLGKRANGKQRDKLHMTITRNA